MNSRSPVFKIKGKCAKYKVFVFVCEIVTCHTLICLHCGKIQDFW